MQSPYMIMLECLVVFVMFILSLELRTNFPLGVARVFLWDTHMVQRDGKHMIEKQMEFS